MPETCSHVLKSMRDFKLHGYTVHQ